MLHFCIGFAAPEHKLYALHHPRPQGVDTGFVSVKGANVLDHFSTSPVSFSTCSANPETCDPRMADSDPRSLSLSKCIERQVPCVQQTQKQGAAVWSTFRLPLLFPICYATCFASCTYQSSCTSPRNFTCTSAQCHPLSGYTIHKRLRGMREKERAPALSLQSCCNSFKITHWLCSRVSQCHDCKTPPPNLLRSPPFVAAPWLPAAPTALLPTSRVYFGLFLLCLFLDRLFLLPARLPLVRNKSMGNLLNPSLG